MVARIFKPSRTAMQSGQAKTRRWCLEFEQQTPRVVEPLMGWTSSTDTLTQVRLFFPTREEAEAYARRHNMAYEVQEPGPARPRPRISYADNFSADRRIPWTH